LLPNDCGAAPHWGPHRTGYLDARRRRWLGIFFIPRGCQRLSPASFSFPSRPGFFGVSQDSQGLLASPPPTSTWASGCVRWRFPVERHMRFVSHLSPNRTLRPGGDDCEGWRFSHFPRWVFLATRFPAEPKSPSSFLLWRVLWRLWRSGRKHCRPPLSSIPEVFFVLKL